MLGLGALQPGADISRRHRPHVVDGGKLLLRSGRQGIKGPEVGGQGLPRLLPHLPDPQGIQQPLQPPSPALIDGPQGVLRRFVPHALQGGKLVLCQKVQVRWAPDHLPLDELAHDRRPDALNVHGVPAGEVGQVPVELGGTLRPRAAQEGPVLIPDHRRAAHRTHGGHPVGHRLRRTPVQQHLHHLGDDLPCLLHHHCVAYADVLLLDIVLVVEAGGGDGGPRQADRLHHHLGGQHTGPSHLDHNVHDPAGLSLRGVLVGDGPAGRFGGAANNSTVRQGIQLYNCSIHIKGQPLPLLVEPADLPVDLLRLRERFLGDHREALALQIGDGLTVAGEGPPLRQLQVEHPDVQIPFGADLGVQLPERSRRGVPGVGEEVLSPLLPLAVQAVEHALGHEHLPPDDEPGQLLRQHQRDRADGAEVLRHILPHPAIAPGGALEKHAVPVLQGHAQAVHLGLHAVDRFLQVFRHPSAELPHLLRGEHILKALQGNGVDHLLKALQSLSPHPLGGGVGGDLLRVRRLQLLQAAQHVVVVVVGQGGIVQHVVAVARLIERAAQPRHLAFVVHGLSFRAGRQPRRSSAVVDRILIGVLRQVVF